MGIDPSLLPQIVEQLDVPLLTLDITSFEGGMVNKRHATLLEANQASLLQNIQLKHGALAEKRPGITNKMSAPNPPTGKVLGLGYWNPPSSTPSEKIVSISQGFIHEWTGTGSWAQVVGASFTGDQPVYFVQGAALIPSFSPVAWIFQKGASAVYQYDGSTTVTQVSGQPSGFAGSVPTGVSAVFWLGRLWVAQDGANNGNIRFSIFGKPTEFNLSEGYLVNPNDPVTRIVQWFNSGILVFQRNSIHVLDIDQGNFGDIFFEVDSTRIETLNYDIGCIAGKSIAQSGQDFFFLSRFGVMQLSKTERDKAIGRAIPLSDPIEATLHRVNWNAAERASGVVWDNVYYLAIPVDGSTRNNLVIAYDLQEQAWYEISGWEAGDWLVSTLPSVEERLYFGTSNETSAGKVYHALDEDATLDDSVALTGTIETARYDFGTTALAKTMRFLDVFTDSASGGSVEVYAAPNNQDFTLLGTITVASGGLTLPFFLPPVGNPVLGASALQRDRFSLDQFGEVREIQFRFKMTGAGQTKIFYCELVGQANEHTWS